MKRALFLALVCSCGGAEFQSSPIFEPDWRDVRTADAREDLEVLDAGAELDGFIGDEPDAGDELDAYDGAELVDGAEALDAAEAGPPPLMCKSIDGIGMCQPGGPWPYPCCRSSPCECCNQPNCGANP